MSGTCCMFPGPYCDQFNPFYFCWFWNSSWQIWSCTHILSSYQPHPAFVPNIDTAVCDANMQAGKGQEPAVAELRFGSSRGETAMNGLVLLSSLQWAALHLSWRCGLWGQCTESVYVRVGCHLAVTQSAKYNITIVVGLCGLSVCSVPLWRKGLALLSIFPLSLPDTQHFSFIEHLTCLYRNQDASSTLALMEGVAASTGAPRQPG